MGAPVVPAPAYRGDEVETRDARAHPYDPYATVPVDATYKEEKLPPQPLKKAVQILTQQSKISQDTPEVAADATYKGDRKARGYTLPQAPPSAPVVPAPAYKIKAPAAAAEPYKVHEEVKKARQYPYAPATVAVAAPAAPAYKKKAPAAAAEPYKVPETQRNARAIPSAPAPAVAAAPAAPLFKNKALAAAAEPY